ncbi:MAG: hypothetical protein AB1679_00835 [Actinomycetota bacterium]
MAEGYYDEAERAAEEARLRALLATIRAGREATASPMVDANLRSMEELCLHALTFFTADIDLHPYTSALSAHP